MAADLHIHVCNADQLDNARAYLSVEFYRVGGVEDGRTGYYEWLISGEWKRMGQFTIDDYKAWHDANKIECRDVFVIYDKRIIDTSPNIWIGEVSWLKASLLNDRDAFVPDTVGAVSALIGDNLPIIDERLIADVAGAFDLPNKSAGYRLANKDKVVAFLRQYVGQHAFCISW